MAESTNGGSTDLQGNAHILIDTKPNMSTKGNLKNNNKASGKVSNDSSIDPSANSSAFITPVKPRKPIESNNGAAGTPPAGSKEFVLQRSMEKGDEVSPLKAFSAGSHMTKRKNVERHASLLVFKIPASSTDEADYPVALILSGDFFDVKDIIKESVRFEQECNRVTIPVPRDALAAKFLSRDFLAKRLPVLDKEAVGLKKFLMTNVDVGWMLFAPPIIDLTADDSNVSAALNAAVDLQEYARCWERALSGEPIHFHTVEMKEFYVGVEELHALQYMYTAWDSAYNRR